VAIADAGTCPKGHALTKADTFVNAAGKRQCRRCLREGSRDRREPMHPEGLEMLVCRPCRIIGSYEYRCGRCGQPATRAVILNTPPADIADDPTSA
jgi:hypothetical protein